MIAHKVIQCPSGTCVCDTLPLQLYTYLFIYLFSLFISLPFLFLLRFFVYLDYFEPSGWGESGRAGIGAQPPRLGRPALSLLFFLSCRSPGYYHYVRIINLGVPIGGT